MVLQEWIEEEDVDAVDITLIKLEMPILKELGAKWLMKMGEYLADNPQFIVNGFRRSGISGALDWLVESEEQSEDDSESIDRDKDSESDEDSERIDRDEESGSDEDSDSDEELSCGSEETCGWI